MIDIIKCTNRPLSALTRRGFRLFLEKPQKPPILPSVSTATALALSDTVHEECDDKRSPFAKKVMKPIELEPELKVLVTKRAFVFL